MKRSYQPTLPLDKAIQSQWICLQTLTSTAIYPGGKIKLKNQHRTAKTDSNTKSRAHILDSGSMESLMSQAVTTNKFILSFSVSGHKMVNVPHLGHFLRNLLNWLDANYEMRKRTETKFAILSKFTNNMHIKQNQHSGCHFASRPRVRRASCFVEVHAAF